MREDAIGWNTEEDSISLAIVQMMPLKKALALDIPVGGNLMDHMTIRIE